MEQQCTSNLGDRILASSLVLLVFFLFLSTGAVCQTKLPSEHRDQASQNKNAPRFDIVSIRPSSKDESPDFEILPDGFAALAMPVSNTILAAYFPLPYFKHQNELKGVPAWVSGELYDIRAKVSAADLEEWQRARSHMIRDSRMLQTMLRVMLADRLKLVMRNMPVQVDGYALALNRHKLRLEPEGVKDVSDVAGMQLLDGGKAVHSLQDSKSVWTFFNTSMPEFVDFLTLNANVSIVDKTGLQGKYHFSVSTFDTEQDSSDGSVSAPERIVPFDLEAIGLHLEHVKIPTDSWGIVSIQRPSAN